MRVVVIKHLSDDQAVEMAEAETSDRLELVQRIYDQLDEDESGQLLSGFCTGGRETYNDDAWVTDTHFVDGSDTSGLINVSFTGSAYLGCKDMDVLYEHDEGIKFQIDLAVLRIEFSTNPPDPEVRYPDDEF